MISSALTLSLALALHLAGLSPASDAVPAGGAAAHPHFNSLHERSSYMHRQQVARRALTHTCGEVIQARRAKRSAMELSRLQKRSMEQQPMTHMDMFQKRMWEDLVQRQDSNSSTTSNSSTCVLDPEVTQGPYHILGELYRQNVTGNQGGLPITYEVDFVDVNTCEPIANAWVDYWSANATGHYSGFESNAGGGGGGVGGGNGTFNGTSGSGSGSASGGPPSDTGTGAGSPPSGSGAGSGSGDGGGMGSMATSVNNNDAFLRGVWRTDSDGHLTLYSVVPGWYTGRTVHAHLKLYDAGSGYVADNGTFVANASAHHTGQWFYPEDVMALIAAESPYSENSQSWNASTKNDEDSIFAQADSNGNNALLDLTYDTSEITKGIVATTVVGVNISFQSTETSGVPTWAGYDGDGSTNLTEFTSASGSGSSSSGAQSNSARRSLSLLKFR